MVYALHLPLRALPENEFSLAAEAALVLLVGVAVGQLRRPLRLLLDRLIFKDSYVWTRL